MIEYYNSDNLLPDTSVYAYTPWSSMFYEGSLEKHNSTTGISEFEDRMGFWEDIAITVVKDVMETDNNPYWGVMVDPDDKRYFKIYYTAMELDDFFTQYPPEISLPVTVVLEDGNETFITKSCILRVKPSHHSG